MGRRQSHPPGDREVGWGVGAFAGGWEWGPAGVLARTQPPQEELDTYHLQRPCSRPKPACPSACAASSSNTDIDHSQPAATLTHTTSLAPRTLHLTGPWLIFLPNSPHLWACRSWLPAGTHAVKLCWVEELLSEWLFNGSLGSSASL